MMKRLVLAGLLILASLTAFAQEAPAPITATSAGNVQFSTDLPVEGVINDIAFSPDGTLLITAGEDTAVRVWSLTDSTQVTESFEHFSFVKDAVFTDSVLATAGWDRTLITWQLENGELTAQAQFAGYDAVIEQLAVSPDGAVIVFGVGDGRVRVADSATGEVKFELPVGALRVAAVAYSPTGETIATAGGFPAEGAALWDANTGVQIATLAHPATVTALAYTPDGEILAVAGEDGTVTLWQDGAQIASLAVEDWVTDIAFTPDGSALIAARQDGVMTFWDMTTPTVPALSVAIVAADQAINALALSADGSTLATASDDGAVRLWKVK